MNATAKPEPLAIGCKSTDCENNLHCFLQKKKNAPTKHGPCRDCGADLIDWPRVHSRDIRDAGDTFHQLQIELWRHHYFHKPFNQKAINHAKRKGRILLRDAARVVLSKKLAPANPPFDGRQTHRDKDTICYAQHATATCCRKCLEYWHAIPMGRELTAQELDYCLALIDLYIAQRLPDLDDHPIAVPAMRRKLAAEQTKQPSTVVHVPQSE